MNAEVKAMEAERARLASQLGPDGQIVPRISPPATTRADAGAEAAAMDRERVRLASQIRTINAPRPSRFDETKRADLAREAQRRVGPRFGFVETSERVRADWITECVRIDNADPELLALRGVDYLARLYLGAVARETYMRSPA